MALHTNTSETLEFCKSLNTKFAGKGGGSEQSPGKGLGVS